jgi:hypothetical protein
MVEVGERIPRSAGEAVSIPSDEIRGSESAISMKPDDLIALRDAEFSTREKIARRAAWLAMPEESKRGSVEYFGFRDDAAQAGELLRDWWRSIEMLFKATARATALGETVPPIPEALNAIAGIASYLAVGKIPDPVKAAAAKGRTKRGPWEARDIGVAVAYTLACKGMLQHNGHAVSITDQTPNKTVREAFGVSDRTVRDWQNDCQPDSLGVNDITPDILTNLMKKAGERYSSAGRSTQAISKRDTRPARK